MLFTSPIKYLKAKGFGTANFSLPFEQLQETSGTNSNLVGLLGLEPRTNRL